MLHRIARKEANYLLTGKQGIHVGQLGMNQHTSIMWFDFFIKAISLRNEDE